jgi:uncharacterized protein YndB with AHSA1/START domain
MTMTPPEKVEHTQFDIIRPFAASPRHVFRFFAEPDLKDRWNSCHPDWVVVEDRFDFTIGGGETKRWRTTTGEEQTFTAHYLDIISDQRILYAYEMSFGGKRLSASLVTITFTPAERGTRLCFTEQVAILTGGLAARDPRLSGTEEGLDRLVALLA